MSLVEINWNPSRRQLRQFGAICAVALPLIGWLWGASVSLIAGLAAVGLSTAVIAVVAPRVLKPLYLGLVVVTAPIGMVVGEVALLLLFFGVFLPFGLAFRMAKRDVLQRKFDSEAPTYWQARKPPTGAARYYRQS